MRTCTQLIVLLAIGASTALAGSTWAASRPSPSTPLPQYDEVDKDKDGIVTLAEIEVYPPAIAARLRNCDTNKDSKLSREEYAHCERPAQAPSK